MAVLLSDIETQVRSLVGDFQVPNTDIFTYTSSAVFTLTESNIVGALTSVSVNDVSSGVTNDFDATRNKVTITSPLTSGDIVEIIYNVYNQYSTTELEQYIKAALYQLSINNYTTFIVEGASDEIHPEPEEREKNIIASVAAILIKPDNRSYRLPDITINVPDDLPTDQKISRAISIFKANKHGVFTIS